MVPQDEAPDLIGLMRKPVTVFSETTLDPEELERATRALWASCCEAVQYAGGNPSIIERIAEHARVAREKKMAEEART